jgi:hypothetical protein
MPQFGGKNTKKTKKTSSISKRHFTVVMGGKEHGLYVSSTPSSAARKAVTKLCTANKSKKVEFHIREITHGSKKKTYGPYTGYIEKLREPIELKGRVIKYKPVAKLSGKSGAKKGGMRGGANRLDRSRPIMFFIYRPKNEYLTKEVKNKYPFPAVNIGDLDPNIFIKKYQDKQLIVPESIKFEKVSDNSLKVHFNFVDTLTDSQILATLKDKKNKEHVYNKLKELGFGFTHYGIELQIPYITEDGGEESEGYPEGYPWLIPGPETYETWNTPWPPKPSIPNSNRKGMGVNELEIPYLNTNSLL